MSQYLLYVESSTDVAAVSLYSREKCVAELRIDSGKNHAKLLAAMIAQVMQETEISAEEIASVAVSKGPGSYTGLRVGVSSAKGLCLAWDKPLIALGSLEALAWQTKPWAQRLNAWICPMIDARRMEVYCAIFDANLQVQKETEAKIIDAESFAAILATQKICFVGDGAAKCQEILSHQANAIFAPEIRAHGAGLTEILWEKYDKKSYEPVLEFEPFYLKDYVATVPKKQLW